MKQTKEQRDAWHQLQEMAVDDPAAVSAMARYLAALGLMLEGRRPRDMTGPEPNLQSGFIMTTAQRDILMAEASASMAAASFGRPARLLPEALSLKMISQRSAFSAFSCRAKSCASVETRA